MLRADVTANAQTPEGSLTRLSECVVTNIVAFLRPAHAIIIGQACKGLYCAVDYSGHDLQMNAIEWPNGKSPEKTQKEKEEGHGFYRPRWRTSACDLSLMR